MEGNYPVRLEIDHPSRPLNRLTTAFRLVEVIPIAIVLSLLSGGASYQSDTQHAMANVATGGGIVFLPLVLMIVFRQKYPRWWFDWNLNLMRFSNRVSAYLTLLEDVYPSTDEEQSVHLDIDYPDAMQLNRFLPLVKWLLAIPHYVVLFFLFIGLVGAVILAWFAILFTGLYPRGLFDYVVGVLRWSNRVSGYAFLMITDRYPPFSLS